MITDMAVFLRGQPRHGICTNVSFSLSAKAEFSFLFVDCHPALISELCNIIELSSEVKVKIDLVRANICH